MASKKDQRKLKGIPRKSSRRRDPRHPKVNKHANYRARVGKPLGPGVPGNKSGRNATS